MDSHLGIWETGNEKGFHAALHEQGAAPSPWGPQPGVFKSQTSCQQMKQEGSEATPGSSLFHSVYEPPSGSVFCFSFFFFPPRVRHAPPSRVLVQVLARGEDGVQAPVTAFVRWGPGCRVRVAGTPLGSGVRRQGLVSQGAHLPLNPPPPSPPSSGGAQGVGSGSGLRGWAGLVRVLTHL